MKTYVTFGQEHAHSINGKTFDKDCVAVIEADGPADGRRKAFEYFGPKFSFEYFEDEWDESKMAYYPRGYIPVEGATK